MGLAERVGTDEVTVTLKRGDEKLALVPDEPSHHGVVALLLRALTDDERDAVAGIGHRVVHGGRTFRSSVLIDEAVMDRLRELVALAPLHMPANLAGIA